VSVGALITVLWKVFILGFPFDRCVLRLTRLYQKTGAELAAFVESWRGWVEYPERMIADGR
jgi:hypothetical protein